MLHRRRRSGPANTSTLAMAPSFAPVVTIQSSIDLVGCKSAAAQRDLRRGRCAAQRNGLLLAAGYSKEVLWLIDATPIPLTSLHKWANWNGRTRGLKTHVIYDPRCRPAGASRDYRGHGQRRGGRAVNRSSREFFDKAYADYAWWQRLHEAGCCFVTGPKAMYRCASSQSGRSRTPLRPRSKRYCRRVGLAAAPAAADRLAAHHAAPR